MAKGTGEGDVGGGLGVSTLGRSRAGRILGTLTLERFLVLAGFVSMVLSIIVLTAGDLTLLGPSLLLLVPGAIFTGVLLWKALPWTYLAAGVANSWVAIVAIPFGLVAVLLNPLLGFRYAGFVLAALALLLALPAGISGYRQARWHVRPLTLREGLRTRHGLAAIALVALSIGALTAGGLANRSLPGASSGGESIDFEPSAEVSVVTANSRFQPSSFNVTAGVVTRITVLNEDGARHTFTYTVNGTTYHHELLPTTATRFLVLFAQPGPIPFLSTADEGMVGTIMVVAG